ncbi:hypothetical protein [Vallitalea guaymasensis]|uniref:hypothetical protein n=1 Tax=Vallitalea guaymasensis TaxID=1185412 RepID=UPI0023531EC9|nr:hypothetical protein [Vallitalea guaymasensis]
MVKGLNISIFTGNFGSGKTEMAINSALRSAEQGKKTVLVDVDVVNPFFRSAEVKPLLEEKNIKVITPNFATTNLDIPSLPASIYSVFSMENTNVFFDVGGDEDGATSLGQFKSYFDSCDYKMYFVINTRRPFTNNEEDIIGLMKQVELRSRLKITDLVNNTNLSYETTEDIILQGQKIIDNVSDMIGIPITYINAKKDISIELPEKHKGKLFYMDLFMQPKF